MRPDQVGTKALMHGAVPGATRDSLEMGGPNFFQALK